MNSPRPDLLVAPCSYQAAKYAVEKWHYSRRMYVNKMVKFGVWENSRFIGAVVFGTGCRNIGRPYSLDNFNVCELVRVALDSHLSPVSRILSIALKLLKDTNPGLRLVVSFADIEQSHHGGIYQAGNWVYVGPGTNDRLYRVNGEVVHPRAMHNRYGIGGQSIPWLRAHIDPLADSFKTAGKYKYLYPLDRAMRRQIAPLAQPYPKRDTRPVNGDTLATSEIGRFDSEPGALNGSDD